MRAQRFYYTCILYILLLLLPIRAGPRKSPFVRQYDNCTFYNNARGRPSDDSPDGGRMGGGRNRRRQRRNAVHPTPRVRGKRADRVPEVNTLPPTPSRWTTPVIVDTYLMRSNTTASRPARHPLAHRAYTNTCRRYFALTLFSQRRVTGTDNMRASLVLSSQSTPRVTRHRFHRVIYVRFRVITGEPIKIIISAAHSVVPKLRFKCNNCCCGGSWV